MCVKPCPALPCAWALPCARSPLTLGLGADWHSQTAALRVRDSEEESTEGEHAVLSPVVCHSHVGTKHSSCVAHGHLPLGGGLPWGPLGHSPAAAPPCGILLSSFSPPACSPAGCGIRAFHLPQGLWGRAQLRATCTAATFCSVMGGSVELPMRGCTQQQHGGGECPWTPPGARPGVSAPLPVPILGSWRYWGAPLAGIRQNKEPCTICSPLLSSVPFVTRSNKSGRSSCWGGEAKEVPGAAVGPWGLHPLPCCDTRTGA